MAVSRLALLLATALLMTGCSASDSPDDAGDAGDASPGSGSQSSSTGDTTSSAAAETPDPPKSPKAGACHRLRYGEAIAPTSPRRRVSCRSPHTSLTFHVGRLDLQDGRRVLEVDSPQVQSQAATACLPHLVEYLDGTTDLVRRSMLAPVWFTPTLAEADLGADWLRCDVIALGRGRSLMRLPHPLAGALADEQLRERFALCATAAPGAQGFARVNCGAPHAWRAVASVDLEGETYPSDWEMAGQLDQPCTDAAREWSPDPLDLSWAEERPTREQWQAGQRYGLCWVAETD